MRLRTSLAVTVGVALLLADPAVIEAGPQYDIATLGLTDAEHTHSTGYYSQAQALNQASQAIGYSERYNGGSSYLGRTAWLYDGSSTRNIGLNDVEHTGSSGFRYSEAQALNEAGQVIGYSQRYNGGSSSLGTTAWLYNGSSTLGIGLNDAEHTGSGGLKSSQALALNEAGQAIGSSSRYSGGSSLLGYSAWLYNGSSTRNIGLNDAEHTDSGGYKYSYAQALNEASQAIGFSRRYNGGSSSLGTTVWLYNGSSTLDIGLNDAEHTRSDGYKQSSALALNEAGQAIGYSERYNGGSSLLGYSAWLHNGSSTLDIGLTDVEHTRSDGYKNSYAQALNETGRAIGYSQRYNGGSSSLGLTAWLHDGSSTRTIGLTDAEHTRSDGYKYSQALALNEAGLAIGSSERYNGGSSRLGYSAWLYDGSSTRNIGLTDAEHTRSDGYKLSQAVALNEAGQAIGLSYRYNGGSGDLGLSGWFYDDDLDQTFALVFSTRADGYAYTEPQFLSDTGVVLGLYTLFDASVSRQSVFCWSLADGFYDLGDLAGGLEANGWANLYSIVMANGFGSVLGQGMRIDQSGGQMSYLLTPREITPTVPEPGALMLLSSGVVLIGLARWGSRRRRSPLLRI